MQVDGKKILVDPVLSGAASPLAFTTREFKGTGAYRGTDMPEIDYLFIRSSTSPPLIEEGDPPLISLIMQNWERLMFSSNTFQKPWM